MKKYLYLLFLSCFALLSSCEEASPDPEPSRTRRADVTVMHISNASTYNPRFWTSFHVVNNEETELDMSSFEYSVVQSNGAVADNIVEQENTVESVVIAPGGRSPEFKLAGYQPDGRYTFSRINFDFSFADGSEYSGYGSFRLRDVP